MEVLDNFGYDKRSIGHSLLKSSFVNIISCRFLRKHLSVLVLKSEAKRLSTHVIIPSSDCFLPKVIKIFFPSLTFKTSEKKEKKNIKPNGNKMRDNYGAFTGSSTAEKTY